jgi:hypothetical protein
MKLMIPVAPLLLADLVAELDLQLIAFLKTLSLEDWGKQTIVPQWKVKDIAVHLLDGNLRTLWLEQSGKAYCDYLKSLDPFDKAVFSVAWAGEDESKNWFHIAREYTEKWHHQQQIRLAVGEEQTLLKENGTCPI